MLFRSQRRAPGPGHRAKPGEERRRVDDARGEGLRPVRVRGPAEDEGVLVERRAAAGGVGDDGVDVGREGVEGPPRVRPRGRQVPGVPRQRPAAALPARDDDLDAVARGIQSGDRVRVFNDRGSLLLPADVDGVVQPGVVRVPSVRWNKKADDKANANVLTSDRLTDMGGGPAFYSCLVQVERCGD